MRFFGHTQFDNRRRLHCERCGGEQDKAGREIDEAERELSYRWCRACLDEAGPCAAAPTTVIGPDGNVVEGDLADWFRDLVNQVMSGSREQADDDRVQAGVVVTYHGSMASDHGTYWVLEAQPLSQLLIGNAAGRRLLVNRDSVSYLRRG